MLLRARLTINIIFNLLSMPFALVGWVMIKLAEGFIQIGAYFISADAVRNFDEEGE